MRPRLFPVMSMRQTTFVLSSVLMAACGVDSAIAPTPPASSGTHSSKQSTTSNQVLFIHGGGPALSLFIMDDDGTDIRPLGAGLPGSVQSASWAPDGKRILVSAAVADGSSQFAIYAMRQDGTEITMLTVPPPGCTDNAPAPLGKQIVFLRGCEATTTLVLMNADGTGRTVLDEGVVHDVILGPSPKGTEVAYSKGDDIWVLNVATGARTNITNTPALSEFQPAFSPSAKRIAFVRGDASGRGIFTMSSDGTGLTPVADGALWPVWSPDGKRIAFGSGMDTGTNTDVFTANADGTALTNLTPLTPGSERPTAWARY
jgi:Tol biopolymer transport system component